MAVRLTPEQERYYKDLREHMQKHVDEFIEKKKRELKENGPEKLKEELEGLQSYIKGCLQGEIAEMEVNIRFKQRCADALRDLLHK